MTKTVVRLLICGAFATALHAAEFHVAVTGSDANPGTESAPIRTIQHAADLAQAGDTITIHAGVYRERVSPPRGGDSAQRRIVYQAAPGGPVEIKGSEVITNWLHAQGDIWKATLSNAVFGSFNPYRDTIHGDWFNGKGRLHHTGAVYVNGDWLTEAATLEDLLQPTGRASLWFTQVDNDKTTIWAQFKDLDPNRNLVEINVRQTVFYPEKTGINFITVRGLQLSQAATPWAPPTAEQIGLIGTHWSKGWIIESNVIRYSTCSGLALGKYGDEWDNRSESAEGYIATIKRALTNGWNKDTVGGHIVRGNDISHCEQAGIVGSLGAAFSVITGNTIHDIHVRQLFTGAEMAGIKFHGGIDVQIIGNHIYHCCGGLWLDWMAQGARVSRNLFHDNLSYDLFFEVDHGPILVDNNLLLSPRSFDSRSRGVAFVHDLVAGSINVNAYDARLTPFHQAHSTALAGFHDNPRGDDRYYNNLFLQRTDLSQYDSDSAPLAMAGNVFLNGANPSKFELAPVVKADFDPTLRLLHEGNDWWLALKLDFRDSAPPRQIVTTQLLGRAAIPDVPFEQPDGSPLSIDTDYFGKSRAANPTPGPFENPGQGMLKFNVSNLPLP